MKLKNTLLALLTAAASFSVVAGNYDDITERLRAPRYLEGEVTYEVYLPTSADPVVYTIRLMTHNNPDSLSPSDYLISWELPRNGKVSSGFSSYNDGDHFRFRDTRLQEYHFAEDPLPFTGTGGGVQRNAQFVDLLPAFIAETLDRFDTDSTYVAKRKGNVVSAVRRVKGYDSAEYQYTFNDSTSLPEQLEIVYNPAAISEQTVTATYRWFNDATPKPAFTEDALMEEFKEAFTRFRQSNFRAENLKGSNLPTFSYNNTDGRRITHTRGESDLSGPLIMAFVDNKVAGTPDFIRGILDVAKNSAVSVEPVFIFNEGVVPDDFSGNSANGAPGLIRKCGVANFPTVMLVKSDGTVAEVFIGTSPDLDTNLSQAIYLLK